jgi:hypothetical protein
MSLLGRLGSFAAKIAIAIVIMVLFIYGAQWGIHPATLVMFLIALVAVHRLHLKMRERLGDDLIPSQKWLDDIFESKPITPQDGVSEGLPEQGWGISESDRAFFNDFADFARIVNNWLTHDKDSPWRLQEHRETEISDMDDGEPVYGRRYRVFFNQMEMGALTIRPQFEYSSANPQVIAKGEIQYPRLFPFYRITELHNALAHHLVDDRSTHNTGFLYNLMEVMWREVPGASKHSDLEFELQGVASYYLHMLQNARQQAPVTCAAQQ